MKTIWPKIALLVLCCGALAFELWHFRSGSTSTRQSSAPAAPKDRPDFVLLPANEMTGLAHFFGGAKAKIEGWEPTVGDMNDVEADLSQITSLSNKDPDISRHIEEPSRYFRQYGAVVIDGRRSMLVSAFCASGHDRSDFWRKHLIVVNDGGKCYWQALFDVSTQKFTKLSVNGVA